MIANNQKKGIAAQGTKGGWAFGLWLLSFSILAAWLGGCQGAGSTTEMPAAQPSAGVSAPTAAPGGAEQTAAPKPAKAKASGRQPQITVEKDVCDLKEVGIETKLTGQFKFTNTGAAPLKITHVVGCCGSATKGVEAGQEYAPGASGTLEFAIPAPSIPDPAMKRVLYLQTNDPERQVVTLTIKAVVVRRVDFKPERLKLVLRGSNAGCPEITLTSKDGRPFSITDFESTAGTITAEFNPEQKATSFVLKPKVDMAKLERNLVGRISIDVTHPECKNVELWYDTLPEFTISQPNLMMFDLQPGKGIQREIWVLNNYQEEFEIESVTSKNGVIKLLDKTKVDTRYQLRLEAVPPAPRRGEILVTDMIEILVKGGKKLTIPFRGFYR